MILVSFVLSSATEGKIRKGFPLFFVPFLALRNDRTSKHQKMICQVPFFCAILFPLGQIRPKQNQIKSNQENKSNES